MSLASFKAYDIRGKVPSELNEDLARNIGRAYAEHFKPRKVVIGRDMRLSSPAIAGALADGFLDAGVDVVDIGLGGTELVYFASFHLERDGVDGGVAVTASHNPADYNGMKLVTKGAVPISGDSGLKDIERLAERGYASVPKAAKRGTLTTVDVWPAYIAHLLTYVDVKALSPFKLVANAGNGCAGLVIDRIEKSLPLSFVKVQNEPDGTFPNGVPNPILVENHAATADGAARKRTSGSRGTAIMIVASFSTTTATSSRATTWSACSRRSCSPKSARPGRRSFMTLAWCGTPSTSSRRAAVAP
jgi:phosphomannomutase